MVGLLTAIFIITEIVHALPPLEASQLELHPASFEGVSGEGEIAMLMAPTRMTFLLAGETGRLFIFTSVCFRQQDVRMRKTVCACDTKYEKDSVCL